MEETKQTGIAETTKIVVENIETGRHQSSIEIGTPAKNGALKVYFDASNLVEAKVLIDNAILAKEYMAQKIGGAQ